MRTTAIAQLLLYLVGEDVTTTRVLKTGCKSARETYANYITSSEVVASPYVVDRQS